MKKLIILSLVALFTLGTVSYAAPADPPTKKELRKEQKRIEKEKKKEEKRLKKLEKQKAKKQQEEVKFDPADATEGDASNAV